MSDDKLVSIWTFKPWWCQPWSIVLTGITLIAGSGWLTHRLWVAGLVAVPILSWMGYFLLLYPRLLAVGTLHVTSLPIASTDLSHDPDDS